MRFVPNWLHSRLIRFRWYRRQCGIPEVSHTILEITRASLRILEANLKFAENIQREYPTDGKAGGMISIAKPPRYTVRTGVAK